MTPTTSEREAQFQAWWRASKYCQVAYGDHEQVARDAWQAALTRQKAQQKAQQEAQEIGNGHHPFCNYRTKPKYSPGCICARMEQQEAQGAVAGWSEAEQRATLVNSLRASKSWMTGYAEAFVDAFQDHARTTPPAPVDVRVAVGWRVMMANPRHGSGERWEIYDPAGNRGVVSVHDVQDPTVQELLDALTLLDGQPAGVDAGANVRSYAEGDRVAWTSRLGKKFEGTVLAVIEPVSTRYEVALNDGTYVCAFGSDLAALGGGGGRG